MEDTIRTEFTSENRVNIFVHCGVLYAPISNLIEIDGKKYSIEKIKDRCFVVDNEKCIARTIIVALK